jgi:predicted N-acetyltransferase YhbS
LRSLPGAVSLVADDRDEVVGHILFTPVHIDPTSVATPIRGPPAGRHAPGFSSVAAA